MLDMRLAVIQIECAVVASEHRPAPASPRPPESRFLVVDDHAHLCGWPHSFALLCDFDPPEPCLWAAFLTPTRQRLSGLAV